MNSLLSLLIPALQTSECYPHQYHQYRFLKSRAGELEGGDAWHFRAVRSHLAGFPQHEEYYIMKPYRGKTSIEKR